MAKGGRGKQPALKKNVFELEKGNKYYEITKVEGEDFWKELYHMQEDRRAKGWERDVIVKTGEKAMTFGSIITRHIIWKKIL